jgi:hypothetical protein
MSDVTLLARRRRELHALGHSLFGKRWDVARHTLIGQLTDYASDSSLTLSLEQLESLIADLRRRKMVAAIRRGAEGSE